MLKSWMTMGGVSPLPVPCSQRSRRRPGNAGAGRRDKAASVWLTVIASLRSKSRSVSGGSQKLCQPEAERKASTSSVSIQLTEA